MSDELKRKLKMMEARARQEAALEQLAKAMKRGGGQYDDFSASVMYCPTCKRPMPVKRKLSLYLPGGELYHYYCTGCGTVLGKQEDSGS